MARKLHEWEKDLSVRFLRVKLLGEIELNQAEFDDLTTKIRTFIKSTTTVQEATRRFEQYYPCTFATFLAHFAARNTKREFWDALGSLVGTSSSDLNNANWRKLFINILKANKKTTFENVGGVTNKYVTAIRIHGGIPVYSLNDFFKNMLNPAIDQDQYSGLSPIELRDALLERSDVQIFTDSPVRNFFENSGNIGLAFLSECIKMARAYKLDGEVPLDLDLPAYVVEKFITFTEQQVEFETKLKSPRLLFDPEGDGLVVELPQQQISAKDLHGNEQAIWQVSWDDQSSVLPKYPRLAFSGRDIVSRADQTIIPKPVKRVRVAFGLQSHESLRILRRWSLHFLPEDNQPPLLAFNLRNDNFSSLLRLNQTLPPKTVLLLHPKDIELRFEGQAEKRHECNTLSGAWSNWQADYWSLEEAWQVSLFRAENQIGVFRVSPPAEVPILVDGKLSINNADPKDIPLYIGIPPRLRIPYRPGQQWQIHLESIWDTRPYICKDFTASDLRLNEDSLDLDLVSALDQESAGTYLLGFTNHQDIEGEYRFRIWPRLYLSDLPEAIFPTQELSQTKELVTFTVDLPVAAICEPQTGIDYLEVKGQYGHFSIRVIGEDVTRADLNLILPAKDQMALVSVPLFVPIPRLQWRFVLPGEESVQWTTTPLQKSVDAFLQAIQHNPVSVLIHIPRIESIVNRLELVLIAVAHNLL